MNRLSTGQYVEAYVKDMFEDVFYGTFRDATREDDLFFGTDFYINSVPIDVTINSHKSHSKFIKKYVLDGITVNVLKRFGNKHCQFKQPVLVFHFEMYDLRDRMMICEFIEENLTRDIVSEMIGLYS